MSGIKEITQLLASMEPALNPNTFVFCTSQNLTLEQASKLNPLGLMRWSPPPCERYADRVFYFRGHHHAKRCAYWYRSR